MNKKILTLISASLSLWILAGAALFYSSCTTAERTQQFTLTEEEQKKVAEYQAETDVGRSMAGRLLAFYGNQESQEMLRYINRVGNYVASYGDYPDRRYMFEILDSEVVNAFACPGGYILISKGAIRHAQTEAELAAILGHEAVHVGYKHMFNTLKSMSSEEMEKTAAEASGKSELPESLMVRKRLEPEVSETGSKIATYLSGASAGLSVLKASRAGMSLILEKGLGAEKEYEADREGVKYAIRAGYDPTAFEDFLCRLQKEKEGKTWTDRKCRLEVAASTVAKGKKKSILDKTHPPIPERVKNVRQALVELNADEIIGAVGKKRFEKMEKLLGKKKAEKES